MVLLVGKLINSKYMPESSFAARFGRVFNNSDYSQVFLLGDVVMGKKIDLLGQKFGRLTVIEENGLSKHKVVLWKCICDCGGVVTVSSNSLRSGHTKSCGCLTNKIDLTGKKFGRWDVIKENGRDVKGSVLWECICKCGKISTVRGDSLRKGESQSCGCLPIEQFLAANTTHGRCGSPVYTVWIGIHTRCNNPNNAAYKNYGGRGITVCKRWEDIENFIADMGDRPEGFTIERIDNNLGYSPENCCWATLKEQGRNKRTNRLVKYGGETKCLVEWAEELDIKYSILYDRLQRHPPEIAFNM